MMNKKKDVITIPETPVTKEIGNGKNKMRSL